MRQEYSKLARRMILISLVVSLLPLYVFGAAIYFYLSYVQEVKQTESLRSLAMNRSSAIGLFLGERTSVLEALAETSSLDQLSDGALLEKVLGLLNRRARSFIDLGVIDPQGLQLAYAGPYSLAHRDYSDAPWFEETRILGVHVSDVFLGYRGVPHFVVAVKKGNRSDSWVLRATIDSEIFTKMVRSAQLGPNGDAYILNREGLYQTPPRFGGAILDQAELDPKSIPRGLTVRSRTRPDGVRVLTAFAWLPKEDWLLVIEEEVGLENTSGGIVLAILAIGSAAVAIAILILVRTMINRLDIQDRQQAAIDAQLAHSARLVSLGRMAAGVAHEINNPLAAIGELAGLMEDLMEDTVQGEHAGLFRENVMKIQEHVDRARDVTHRLLGFARRMEPRWDNLDVNKVIEEAWSFVEKEAVFRGVSIVLDLDAHLPEVKSDRSQLQQVFLNLMDNAIDAVDEGGHVKVETRIEKNEIMVRVSDDGPGVPPDKRERIFDPFYTTKAPGEGVGLGLSISHSIMAKLGGGLTLEDQSDSGAVFTVRIPLGEE